MQIPPTELFRQVRQIGVDLPDSFDEYVTVDNNTILAKLITDEAIIDTIVQKYNPTDEESNSEDIIQPTPTPPSALASCTTLRQFTQIYENSADMFALVIQLEIFIENTERKGYKCHRLF